MSKKDFDKSFYVKESFANTKPCPMCGSDNYDIDGICYDCEEDKNIVYNFDDVEEYDEDEEYYESKLYTSINEFKKYLNENKGKNIK